MSMRGRRRQRRQVLADAERDYECTSCSRRFAGQAAFQVHHDNGRCLPDGAYGQLVQLRDGRWSEWWRHPEIPRA
jgi:hypothetical protein